MNVTTLLYHLTQKQKNDLLAEIISDATRCPKTQDLTFGIPFPEDFQEHFTDRLENAIAMAERNRQQAHDE